MKVVVCNTYKNRGGAAKASNRLLESFSLNGIDTEFFSLEESPFKKWSFFWSRLERLQKGFSTKDFKSPFSVSKYSLGVRRHIKKLNPDIIHINYINSGLLSIKDVGSFSQPVVWTLHDSWAFTGGCHLPLDCDRYRFGCGNCPLLKKKGLDDLSKNIMDLKERYWRDISLNIVSPSSWLAGVVKESYLFKDFPVSVIPNPVDIDVFKIVDRDDAKQDLGLDLKKKYILFGAVNGVKDSNKGFHFLIKALRGLDLKNTELLIFGSENIGDIDCSIPIKNLGFVSDESYLSKIYSACNLTVIPSISEIQPTVALESLACGVPVVGFSIDALKELIVRDDLGSLAHAYDINSLGEKISEVLIMDGVDREKISRYIKNSFSFSVVGKRYKELFNFLMV